MNNSTTRMSPTETTYLLLPPEVVEDMNAEEVAYYSSIDRAAESKSDKVFENGHPYHALYLIYKLATIVEHQLLIYTGRLGQHWEEITPLFRNPALVDQIDAALVRGVEVKILVEDHSVDLGSHPLAALRKHERFSLSHLHSDDQEFLIQSEFNHHFAVADGESYRLETDDVEVIAEASFCGKDLAGALTELFGQLRPSDPQATA